MRGGAEDIYDPAFVRDVFDRCSDRYIAFSTICSFGFTERWRRQCVTLLHPIPVTGARVLDLMAGTGEVWPHLLRRFPGLARITAVDISSGMHWRALQRADGIAIGTIDFIEDDVLASILKDQSADALISTFGLKTFNTEQHAQLATLIARVLKPGGTFALIEASDPRGWPLRFLYLLHLRVVLPMVERLFLRGAQDFATIGRYCTNFGDAEASADQLRSEGLEVDYHRLFFGCATAVAGRKPAVVDDTSGPAR